MTEDERLAIAWLEQNWEKLGPFRDDTIRLAKSDHGYWWAVGPDRLGGYISPLEALSLVEHVLRVKLKQRYRVITTERPTLAAIQCMDNSDKQAARASARTLIEALYLACEATKGTHEQATPETRTGPPDVDAD